MEIDALFPPIVTQRNQQFSLQVAGLQVRVETPGGEMGEYLEASITVFVDLELFADSGEVGFGLGELNLYIMVTDAIGGFRGSHHASAGRKLALDALLMFVNDFAYPIPSLGLPR